MSLKPSSAHKSKRQLTYKEENILLKERLKNLRRDKLSYNLSSIGGHLIRVGGFVFITYFITDAVKALAGKSTWTDINLNSNIIANLSDIVLWISIAINILLVIFWGRERKLRRSYIYSDVTQRAELEKIIDSGRSSSGLSKTGVTLEEDKES